MDKKINLVTAGQIRNDIPVFHVGDTIGVSVNVTKETRREFRYSKE